MSKLNTVGLILVGDELLTGKVRDENGHYLARWLYDRGCTLSFIHYVPDIHEDIVVAIRRYKNEVDLLITSGGVGPTHDDITYAALAAAFEVPLTQHEQLAERIRKYFGPKTKDAHLKMANLPLGVTLFFPEQASWPTVSMHNVFVFPGVPRIFKVKLNSIRHLLSGDRSELKVIWLLGDEGTIASTLEDIARTFDVQIGCYPISDTSTFNIKVTIESKSPHAVQEAVEALVGRLSALVDALSLNPPTGA